MDRKFTQLIYHAQKTSELCDGSWRWHSRSLLWVGGDSVLVYDMAQEFYPGLTESTLVNIKSSA